MNISLSSVLLVIFFAVLATVAFLLWQPRVAALIDNKDLHHADKLFFEQADDTVLPLNSDSNIMITSEE